LKEKTGIGQSENEIERGGRGKEKDKKKIQKERQNREDERKLLFYVVFVPALCHKCLLLNNGLFHTPSCTE
jgi:hypothetical protein